MGKRSDFPRRPNDFYPTPSSAVDPLVPHLNEGASFYEPCAGDGALVDHLESYGFKSNGYSDIEPQKQWIRKVDALDLHVGYFLDDVDYIITNPPWPARNGNGEPTVSIIKHLMKIRPTWMLLSADFMHTLYFARISRYCRTVVAIGRVKWIPDSKYTSKDNCCWYLFDTYGPFEGTRFHGR